MRLDFIVLSVSLNLNSGYSFLVFSIYDIIVDIHWKSISSSLFFVVDFYSVIYLQNSLKWIYNSKTMLTKLFISFIASHKSNIFYLSSPSIRILPSFFKVLSLVILGEINILWVIGPLQRNGLFKSYVDNFDYSITASPIFIN